jgi:hypothetical protein
MIAKTLEENKRVIHDLKLRGESHVAHQIDVTVEGEDGRKTLLIECKDFDVSGNKVGLSIVLFRPLEPAPARGEGRRPAHCRARQRQHDRADAKKNFLKPHRKQQNG